MRNECLNLINTEKKEVIYSLEKLEELTIKWSEDRGIIKNSNSLTQFAKLISEAGELADNIAKGRNIEDDIGDCLIVLCKIAKMNNTNLTNCWNAAYADIKDRKGYLNENGTFIKDGDVE
jgi:DNA repair ATPase RecN